MAKKKKWYQTGEFEDGYQFGDISKTIGNSISTLVKRHDKEKDESNLKKQELVDKSKTDYPKIYLPSDRGRLPEPDALARKKGYKNVDELKKYKETHPEIYEAMDGVNPNNIINSNVLDKSNIELSRLQAIAKKKIINRFNNSDVSKIKKAIDAIGSGEWQDADTMQKYSDIVGTYVNDYIALDSMGYFNYLPNEERRANVEILRSIKKDVENKNTLYTTFDSVYDYNAYIMNNTAERENGMSVESIAARAKAYEENGARLDVIDNEIANMTDEEKWTKKLSSGSGRMVDSIWEKTDVYKALLDEKEYLEEQIRLYERFNKKNDSLTTQFANGADFAINSLYIPQKDTDGELIVWDVGDYRAFLDYYSVGTNALVHSERVRKGLEPDDYWYSGQSRGWDYATSDEFKMLNYLANTQGDEAAQSYYEALSKDLTRRRSIAKEQKWDKNYKNAEWYEKVGLNVLSVPEKVYGTAVNAIEDIGNLITGQEYYPYAADRDITSHADNTRKNTATEIEELTDNAEFLGVSWGDVYQAAMSGIDSVVGAATFRKAYPVIMGMGATSAKAKQLYEQGASSRQIAAASVFAGVTEMVFEKISIGYFLDEFVNAPAKKWYQLLAKSVAQGGIEMTEEMATELSNIITDTMVLGSRSDWGKLISSYKQQGYSDSDAIISAMWDMGGNILEAGICGLISGGTMSSAGSTVNYLSNNIQDGNKTYISFEEFCNNQSDIWNNVKYLDENTKLDIMRKTHDTMVRDGAIVKVPQEIIKSVAESYPDLRGVKKKERTPILKESMHNLKENIREFLNKFKNRDFEFEVNGKILEARLYSTGINEVLEKITQEKANMLYSTEDIFKNSRYLYSTTDYDGDPNIYRWNYFYTPVQIGEEVVGVRIAVRDLKKQGESQIYNWNIKKDATLDGEGDDMKYRKSHGVSSDASNYNILNANGNVNNLLKKAGSRNGPASFSSKNSGITTTPRINEDNGIRTIGVDKSIDEDAFVEGMWDTGKSAVNSESAEYVENSGLKLFDNSDKSGIIEKNVKKITLDDLTKDVLKTKPPNSRVPKDWIEAGGSIAIDNKGNWIYTDWFGISVKYINGYPDYKGAGVVVQEVDIGGFISRGIDRRKADKLAPNGPRKKGNVWHHSQDGRTMQEIDEEIHRRFTHKGGYSLRKRKE